MLVVHHVKRMRRIIFQSVAFLAVPYFSTLFHKQQDVPEKNNIGQEICFFFLSETFLILRIQRDVFINARTSSCKVPVILVRF